MAQFAPTTLPSSEGIVSQLLANHHLPFIRHSQCHKIVRCFVEICKNYSLFKLEFFNLANFAYIWLNLANFVKNVTLFWCNSANLHQTFSMSQNFKDWGKFENLNKKCFVEIGKNFSLFKMEFLSLANFAYIWLNLAKFVKNVTFFWCNSTNFTRFFNACVKWMTFRMYTLYQQESTFKKTT